MRAGVIEDTDFTISISNEHEWTSGDCATDKVARFFDLRFVAEIEPAAVEYPLLLQVQKFLRCPDGSMDLKDTRFSIVDDLVFESHIPAPSTA
jgi:hypothetical protein